MKEQKVVCWDFLHSTFVQAYFLVMIPNRIAKEIHTVYIEYNEDHTVSLFQSILTVSLIHLPPPIFSILCPFSIQRIGIESGPEEHLIENWMSGQGKVGECNQRVFKNSTFSTQSSVVWYVLEEGVSTNFSMAMFYQYDLV